MNARTTSSPPRRWGAMAWVLVAVVLVAAFLAWRWQPQTSGQRYFHVEALDDGSVLVAEHDFDRDELVLRLVRGASTLWTRSMPFADPDTVGTGVVSTSERVAVPLLSGVGDVAYQVLRRSDGSPTGAFHVAPGVAERAVYGQRFVNIQSSESGLTYDIHDLDSPQAPGIARTVDCMGIAEPFATSSRLLIYSGVINSECAAVVLGDDGEAADDIGLGPWNHTESPWPIAIEPGTDRLLVRTADAIEAWDLAGAAEPERIAALPAELGEIHLLGTHAHRLVLAGHDGDPTWVDHVGHPPRVALLVVDPATRSLVLQTSLAPFAFAEHDRSDPSRELPRFALVRAQARINDETDSGALLVMIDVTTGEESWRTDEMPGDRWMVLTQSPHGSVLMVRRSAADGTSSAVIARFDGATGWLDRAVEVSGASLLGDTSTNGEVVALSLSGDTPGWILLSTETLDVVATSFDDAERDRRLSEGTASLTSLVPLPPGALSRSASLDPSARRAAGTDLRRGGRGMRGCGGPEPRARHARPSRRATRCVSLGPSHVRVLTRPFPRF